MKFGKKPRALPKNGCSPMDRPKCFGAMALVSDGLWGGVAGCYLRFTATARGYAPSIRCLVACPIPKLTGRSAPGPNNGITEPTPQRQASKQNLWPVKPRSCAHCVWQWRALFCASCTGEGDRVRKSQAVSPMQCHVQSVPYDRRTGRGNAPGSCILAPGNRAARPRRPPSDSWQGGDGWVARTALRLTIPPPAGSSPASLPPSGPDSPSRGPCSPWPPSRRDQKFPRRRDRARTPPGPE